MTFMTFAWPRWSRVYCLFYYKAFPTKSLSEPIDRGQAGTGLGRTGLFPARLRLFLNVLLENLRRIMLASGRKLYERQDRAYRQDVGVDNFQ
jgi:hypothetical protein